MYSSKACLYFDLILQNTADGDRAEGRNAGTGLQIQSFKAEDAAPKS